MFRGGARKPLAACSSSKRGQDDGWVVASIPQQRGVPSVAHGYGYAADAPNNRSGHACEWTARMRSSAADRFVGTASPEPSQAHSPASRQALRRQPPGLLRRDSARHPPLPPVAPPRGRPDPPPAGEHDHHLRFDLPVAAPPRNPAPRAHAHCITDAATIPLNNALHSPAQARAAHDQRSVAVKLLGGPWRSGTPSILPLLN